MHRCKDKQPTMANMPPETPILIVDDSAAIRSRMEAYLRKLGFTNIQNASNVEEGLAAFREQGSEVVFLDLVIDEERGADFAAQALDERPFANIVIMTALPSGHEQVTASIAEGAREYLPKPIQLAAVEGVLHRLESQMDMPPSPEKRDVSYL